MSINLSKLDNISPFELNTSIISSGDGQIINNIIVNANTTSDGYLGAVILTLLFVFISYMLYRDDGFFRLDTARAIVKGSGWTFLLGIVLIVSDIITDYRVIVWYGVVFIISGIIMIFIKRRGF